LIAKYYFFVFICDLDLDCVQTILTITLVNIKLSIQYFFLTAICMWACTNQKAPTSRAPGEASSATGVQYNTSDTTFHPDQANDFKPFEPEKIARPNLKLIEGGKSLIGFEDVQFTHNKTQYYSTTVETFYMDETEIANIHWLE